MTSPQTNTINSSGPLVRAYVEDAMVSALAAVYPDGRVVIAKLCDEHLDPSGRLLGLVREEARRAA